MKEEENGNTNQSPASKTHNVREKPQDLFILSYENLKKKNRNKTQTNPLN